MHSRYVDRKQEPYLHTGRRVLTCSSSKVFNYLAGSLSRIFTTIKEVDDPLILYGYIAGFTLNVILAAQVLYYWKSPAKPKKEAEKAPRPVEKVPVAETTGVSPRPTGKTPTTRRRG